MRLTRRAMLPAPVALAALASAQAAQTASPWRIIATADGPWRSRVIEIDGRPIRPSVPARPRGELNQDPYILQIG